LVSEPAAAAVPDLVPRRTSEVAINEDSRKKRNIKTCQRGTFNPFKIIEDSSLARRVSVEAGSVR